MFDKFTTYVLRITSANLTELLIKNKNEFQEVFCSERNGPQFEICVCFN